MASLLNSSSAGFYRAPVVKALAGGLLVTTAALHLPFLSHLRRHFVYNVHDIVSSSPDDGHRFWSLFASQVAFLDLKDMACGCLLLYYFRVFEKRMGSRKFSSYLIVNFIMASLLELGAAYFNNNSNGNASDYLPRGSGPFKMIFPLFINYYLDIPRMGQSHVLGIPITMGKKTLTYLIGLQVITSSRESLIASCCGLVAGLISRLIPICDYLKVPEAVADLVNRFLGCIESEEPSEAQLGATLEIQRQQQIELLEQQMMFSRAREMRERTGSGSVQRRPFNGIPPLSGQSEQVPGPGPSNGNISQPNEQQIQTLVEMGFDRRQVIRALQQTNNDINSATSILLTNEG